MYLTKIMIENQTKKRKFGNERNFYINFYQIDCYGIHSLLGRADAGGSADIIYRV